MLEMEMVPVLVLVRAMRQAKMVVQRDTRLLEPQIR